MNKKKGRLNKYYSHVHPKLELIEHWCKQGAIEEEICKKLGVAVSSFNKYKNEYPKLKEALFFGKQDADDNVEAALYKRAIGYDYEEVTHESVLNPLTKEYELVVSKIVKKHIPADNVSMFFWLKNRRPAEWKDKRDVELSGEINNPFSELSIEELRKLAQKE